MSPIHRVQCLAQFFKEASQNPNHKIDLQKNSLKILQKSKYQAFLPEDIFLVLLEIGEMRSWGYSDHVMVHWWQPMSIAESRQNDLIHFNTEAVERGTELLAFACDCDATVYLLDTASTPFTVVCTDGLDAWSAMKNIGTPDFLPAGIWKLDSDFLSVIEGWAGYSRRAEPN